MIRETAGCGLTHVVAGLGELLLKASEDCAHSEEPLVVAARIQQGDAFAERVKEEEESLAVDVILALRLNSCAFLPRVSEEGNNRRHCPSGYALRGMRCNGSYCDDKDLMRCPYLEGASDPSSKEQQARQISEEFPNVMTSKNFMHGLTCWGPYCDNVVPHVFKSSRLKNARACDWSPWASDLAGSWLDCGEGNFAAGLRCRGDYCADLGLHCCQARLESASR